MQNLNSISTSLTSTLKDSDLQGVTTEWSEVFLDTFLAEGVLKEIPIVSTIIGIGKAGFKVNEMLFVKKLLYFISNVNEISAQEREKMISEIDDSNEYRVKVGEKLLYIIDKCDDHEKAEILGVLFKAFLAGQIDYDDFLSCSLVIEKCLIKELKFFIREDTKKYKINESSELLNWGLLEVAPLEIKLEKNDKNGMSSQLDYKIANKELFLNVSSQGKLIRQYLREYAIYRFKDLKLNTMDVRQINKYICTFQANFQKDKNRERQKKRIIETLIELCKNSIITDLEFEILAKEMIKAVADSFIITVDRELNIYQSDMHTRGNDFNFERWEKFAKDYRNENDVITAPGNYYGVERI